MKYKMKTKTFIFKISEPTNEYVSNPNEVFAFIKKEIPLFQEAMYVLGLNVKNNILNKKRIYFTNLVAMGSYNQLSTKAFEIFRPLILNGTSSFILVHNHPSGDVEPSYEDKIYTNEMEKAANLLGFKLLDHLIVSKDKYYSFKDEGLL